MKLPDYTNSQMETLIRERIHSEVYRQMLLLRYIDGLTYDAIAERTNYSTQHVKRVIYKAQQKLIRFL